MTPPDAPHPPAHLRPTADSLRTRAGQRFPLRALELPLNGRTAPLRVTLPADPDGPLDQLTAALNMPAPTEHLPMADAGDVARANVSAGLHIPYWAVVWPSGIALAEALLAEPDLVRGKRVIEIGCGIGITACAALEAGASLAVADCFEDALLFTQINTGENAGVLPDTLLVDWRTDAGREALLASGPYDVALGADVLYENPDVSELLELLPRLCAVAHIAEPGRLASGNFVRAAEDLGWRHTAQQHSRVWPTEVRPITVSIHHYTFPR